jgi:hypothetical protein
LEYESTIGLCYQDAFEFEIDSFIPTPSPAFNGINEPPVRADGAITIDFGTVALNGREDLHTKLSLSSFIMLVNSIADLESLPQGCNFLQQTTSTASVTVGVTLKSMEHNSFVMPQPSQSIVLSYLGMSQSTEDYYNYNENEEIEPFTYALEFGLGRGGQSTGEFYFLNAPEGLYDLEFEIRLSTQTSATCNRRLEEAFGRAMAVVGSHVVSIEKIDVLQSGQCQAIATGGVVPLPFLA